eukprot:PITA_32738
MRLNKIVESINVAFDEGCKAQIRQDSEEQETKEPRKEEKVKEEPLEEEPKEPVGKQVEANQQTPKAPSKAPKKWYQKNHSSKQIIGYIDARIRTRRSQNGSHPDVLTSWHMLAPGKIKVYQMDVKSAFLNGDLEEDVYKEQPKGFILIDNKDCLQVKESTIRSSQASPESMISHGDGIFISQSKHIIDMLRKFQTEDCKPVSTPMVIGCKLSKDNESKEFDQKLYRSMIGSLLYVRASRLEVMQAVEHVARFQATPKESHVLVVKSIFKYLKWTTNFGIWFPEGNELVITAYTHAD